MSEPTLLSLPPELLRQIMVHSDYKTLTALSETSTYLLSEASNESLWCHLAQRRFRVKTNAPTSRRLQAAGPISWRTLYANWHVQSRMPVSRHSGPTFRAFARGAGAGALVWVLVQSTDDCRLRDGALRLRLVVQNIASRRLRVPTDGLSVVLADGEVKVCEGGAARVVEWEVDRAADGGAPLAKDDFVSVGVEIDIAQAVFEVDALERLVEMRVRIAEDGGKEMTLGARFVEKEIWDAYDLLPGGWWVRVN